MIKNIVIAILAIAVVVLFFYGVVQQIEATKRAEDAGRYKIIAEKNVEEAIKQRQAAISFNQKSEEEIARLKKIVDECLKSKK